MGYIQIVGNDLQKYEKTAEALKVFILIKYLDISTKKVNWNQLKNIVFPSYNKKEIFSQN